MRPSVFLRHLLSVSGPRSSAPVIFIPFQVRKSMPSSKRLEKVPRTHAVPEARTQQFLLELSSFLLLILLLRLTKHGRSPKSSSAVLKSSLPPRHQHNSYLFYLYFYVLLPLYPFFQFILSAPMRRCPAPSLTLPFPNLPSCSTATIIRDSTSSPSYLSSVFLSFSFEALSYSSSNFSVLESFPTHYPHHCFLLYLLLLLLISSFS